MKAPIETILFVLDGKTLFADLRTCEQPAGLTGPVEHSDELFRIEVFLILRRTTSLSLPFRLDFSVVDIGLLGLALRGNALGRKARSQPSVENRKLEDHVVGLAG